MIKIIADKPEDKKSLRGKFIKFKKAITNPEKNSDNPFTESKYVDLAAVLEVIAKGEQKSDLAFTQDVGTDENNRLFCRSILMGEDGSIVSSPMCVPVVSDGNKRGSQEYGSAETYLRRYSAQSLCGFAGKDEDDDGNASTTTHPQSQSGRRNQGRRQYDDNGQGMKGKTASSGQKRFAGNLARRAKGCQMTEKQQAACDWVLGDKSKSGDMYAWSRAIDTLQEVDTSKRKPTKSQTTGQPPHENQQSLFGGAA